ncbi:MAG: ChrR family anti-sigma-E factor [Hyphomicrobium sp.]|jgi:putative transcriptional regulator
MTIQHHPDIASLMSCAAGSQPEAIAAVVSAHLAMCPECRREICCMEKIGVALFASLAPAPLSCRAPVVAARAREADRDVAQCLVAQGDVPAPLAPVLGACLDGIPWKRLFPGVWQHRVRLSACASGDLRLFKIAPGTKLPEHRHNGEEMTLILRGSYHDKLGTFRTGDIADLDDAVEHGPIADEVEGCICLVAVEGKVRYKGLIARLLQPILGV